MASSPRSGTCPVVGHGEQDRGRVVVEVDVIGVVETPLEPVEQALGLEAAEEHDLDLGPGRLGAEQAGVPVAGEDRGPQKHHLGPQAGPLGRLSPVRFGPTRP